MTKRRVFQAVSWLLNALMTATVVVVVWFALEESDVALPEGLLDLQTIRVPLMGVLIAHRAWSMRRHRNKVKQLGDQLSGVGGMLVVLALLADEDDRRKLIDVLETVHKRAAEDQYPKGTLAVLAAYLSALRESTRKSPEESE